MTAQKRPPEQGLLSRLHGGARVTGELVRYRIVRPIGHHEENLPTFVGQWRYTLDGVDISETEGQALYDAEMTAPALDTSQQIELDHVVLVGPYVSLTCSCGWKRWNVMEGRGIAIHELQQWAHEHVASIPGYVPYYRRPDLFDIDDEEP